VHVPNIRRYSTCPLIRDALFILASKVIYFIMCELLNAYTYIHMYVCMNVAIYLHTYVYAILYMYVYMYVTQFAKL